ncbi:MAG: hypothetical protein KDA84_05635, partial [Planctomycetaceae bacterium]|nr:hypothetical protein [Planctomycetaceae bacterium]
LRCTHKTKPVRDHRNCGRTRTGRDTLVKPYRLLGRFRPRMSPERNAVPKRMTTRSQNTSQLWDTKATPPATSNTQ